MALIAVDRVQNYFQYKDAEAKYYQTLKSETKDLMVTTTEKIQQPPILIDQITVESKSKKIKKNKNKSTSSENSQDQKIEFLSEKATEYDISLKTDQVQALTATAKKNAAKKKKQREKKAAAALAAKQSDQVIESLKTTETNVYPPSATKAKEKKKKTKPATPTDEKNGVGNNSSTLAGGLATEIAKAREHIKSSLDRVVNLNNMPGSELLERISSLEKDNQDLRGIISGLQNLVVSLEGRLNKLDGGDSKRTAAPSAPAKQEEEEDDVDLFGSDEEEDAEAEKLKEERVKAYAEKKSKKPALIAKSSILLDCKPWDDETDMGAMEKQIRTIEMDGLIWGVSKLVPLAYGIKKLQILCVIEDDKVSVDELQEKIQEFEDFVQSVDIAAFNKI